MKKHSIILTFAIIILSLYSAWIIPAQATCTWNTCTNVTSTTKSWLSTDIKNFLLKLASLRSKQKTITQTSSSSNINVSTSTAKVAADKLAAQQAAAKAAQKAAADKLAAQQAAAKAAQKVAADKLAAQQAADKLAAQQAAALAAQQAAAKAAVNTTTRQS